MRFARSYFFMSDESLTVECKIDLQESENSLDSLQRDWSTSLWMSADVGVGETREGPCVSIDEYLWQGRHLTGNYRDKLKICSRTDCFRYYCQQKRLFDSDK